MNKTIQEKYEYSYQVADNSVDINALLISQLHFSTIVNEVAKKVNPELQLNIRVIAPKGGSFVFQQVIECIYSPNILSGENIHYIADIFVIVGGIIGLKQWLGGKKAEKIEHNGDNVNITFNGETKGVTFNIFNIYSKDKIINSAIEKDEAIDGLIIQNKHPIIEVKKENFNALTSSNGYLEGDTKEEIKPLVKLFIKNPDLVPKNPKLVKWDFLYDGIYKIKAQITDQKFLDDISNTVYRIGAWDAIIADVKIISKFNEAVKVFLPDVYEVVKVHKIDYRIQPKQSKIEGEGF